MTIHLPKDVERDILAEVHSGHFASVDDALAAAWRAFRQHRPFANRDVRLLRLAANEASRLLGIGRSTLYRGIAEQKAA